MPTFIWIITFILLAIIPIDISIYCELTKDDSPPDMNYPRGASRVHNIRL